MGPNGARALRLGAAFRNAGAQRARDGGLRAARELRGARARRDAIGADARSLPAAALRARPAQVWRAGQPPGRRLRRRLDLDARRTARLERLQILDELGLLQAGKPEPEGAVVVLDHRRQRCEAPVVIEAALLM